MTHSVPEIFGSMAFGDAAMKERLPKNVYRALQQTIREGTPLDPAIADAVANAMKDWALSKGATHFTHWFQPMTGITAEKHDSFLTPAGGGAALMEFSGKELIKGEPDASSFPSGGLRATFEARGYTSWDPTSYAFIKDNTLCIPTAFCSYTGEVLDKKTPLLRSMDAISHEACRVLKLFGKDCKRVTTTVGPEQEYFLINKEDYAKRRDLILTGRTLFGAPAPKGQELEDHYFGSIRPRVKAFMDDLNEELWKVGVYAKTEHNEVAPAQHEMAPIFETTNIATDHNQLTMELMRKVADRHGFVCLLHEKPFEGINGSGKHNNWSMGTDTGLNLLDPGTTPAENGQFMLFLMAVIKAVNDYQDLLRLSVASAGNDHRLGANEAPPAIVSVFVGEELGEILSALDREEQYTGSGRKVMQLGVDSLPVIPKDTTDRNRTSPFAFTGNKFEFRMVGSSFSLAGPNIVINTIVADTLRQFAEELEKAPDFNAALHALVVKTIRENKRIIFNGNNYSPEWTEEAAKRGLCNLKNAAEALPHFADEKNISLFERMKVFTAREVITRTEIMLENYSKVLTIEGLTMLNMARRDIFPAVSGYIKTLAAAAADIKAALPGAEAPAEEETARELLSLNTTIAAKAKELESLIAEAQAVSETGAQAAFFAGKVLPVMEQLRSAADSAEVLTDRSVWPFPTYGDLLFSVN